MDKSLEDLHISVLPCETLTALAPHPGGKYLDGTVGMGGHSLSLLKAVPDIEICALDRDEEALRFAAERLSPHQGKVHFFHLPFSEFEKALSILEWEKLDGCLLDLGVSSYQLDESNRGFSFRKNGPLDMRMDAGKGKPAMEIVNTASFEELREIISVFGEDPQASRIAKAIIAERKKHLIKDTGTLAEIIRLSYPVSWREKSRNHPATRTFQALRMAVNGELDELTNFMERILSHIAHAGRIVIISFHSLEDRIVKNAMRNWARAPVCHPAQRGCSCNHIPEIKILYKKPLQASSAELMNNPRSRSAKLRAAEKI